MSSKTGIILNEITKIVPDAILGGVDYYSHTSLQQEKEKYRVHSHDYLLSFILEENRIKLIYINLQRLFE